MICVRDGSIRNAPRFSWIRGAVTCAISAKERGFPVSEGGTIEILISHPDTCGTALFVFTPDPVPLTQAPNGRALFVHGNAACPAGKAKNMCLQLLSTGKGNARFDWYPASS